MDQEVEALAEALAEAALAVASEAVASEVASAEVISADLADLTDRTDHFIMAVGITDIITEAAVVSAVSSECL